MSWAKRAGYGQRPPQETDPMRLDRRGLMLGTLAAAAAPSPPRAQGGALPADRPVTLVVPFPPGGSVDGVARILAQELGEQTGGAFLVENRAGGAGGRRRSGGGVRAVPAGAALLFHPPIPVVAPLLIPHRRLVVVNVFSHIR